MMSIAITGAANLLPSQLPAALAGDAIRPFSVLLSAAQKTAEISLPVAITLFPEEVYRAPET